MDNLTQNYEKYINEIQYLKKQVNAEKLAHQNSLKQLHSTYQIIDQIKEMLRIEQSNNLKLKAQLADKNTRITTISNQYEEQIGEIKQIITLKDEELRKMSSVLIVSDYDMIRLRVVNELQLSHRQEVQRLNSQIHKKEGQMAQLRSRITLISNKYQHLSSEIKKQDQQFGDQKQQLNKKYMIQIKNLYQTTERQRNEAHKWQKKYEILENKMKKQTETFKEQIAKMTRELQIQNKAILSNTNSKSTKMKLQKLQQQFIKLKEEYIQEKQNNRRFQQQNNRLKKQIKAINKQTVDIRSQKDKLTDQIQDLKRELQAKDRQKVKQLQAAKRNFENTSQNIGHTNKSDKQKINKLQLQNKRLNFKLSSQEEQLTILRMKPKQNNLNLIRKELDDKNEEIERLILELDNYKKKERTKSVIDKKEQPPQYKKKLNEANQKIVQLLKQKIQLSRQINFLKSASPAKH